MKKIWILALWAGLANGQQSAASPTAPSNVDVALDKIGTALTATKEAAGAVGTVVKEQTGALKDKAVTAGKSALHSGAKAIMEWTAPASPTATASGSASAA